MIAFSWVGEQEVALVSFEFKLDLSPPALLLLQLLAHLVTTHHDYHKKTVVTYRSWMFCGHLGRNCKSNPAVQGQVDSVSQLLVVSLSYGNKYFVKKETA